MCLRRKVGKSDVLLGGFCLHDSEAEQRALQLLYIYCSNLDSYSSAPESNKRSPPNRTLDLPFFRCKHITSLKNFRSPAPSESLLQWFQGNFAALFVLNFLCLHSLIHWGVNLSN